MKIKCPRCKRIMKEFTPSTAELPAFEEDEIRNDEAFHHKACTICAEVASKTHWA